LDVWRETVKSLSRFAPPLAIALAAIFFGIAAYINLAEQPSRLTLDAASMLAQWKISFASGIAIQGALAIVAGIVGLASWWITRDWRWMIGGVLMLANWPWTLAVIAPINSALNGTAADAAGAASIALIERWGQLHMVRTGLALCALAVFVWALSAKRD
jgi:hypothetical protein